MSKVKIKLNTKKESWNDSKSISQSIMLIIFPLAFYYAYFQERESLVLKYKLFDLCGLVSTIGVIRLLYRLFNRQWIENTLNCSYCDKELKVRCPKENIQCPKCKTLHVIDWDKE